MEKHIFFDDIEPLNNEHDIFTPAYNRKVNRPIMKGQFRCFTFKNGLSIHIIDATEEQDTSNSFDLPPGLSFNFVFHGKVDFVYGSEQYRMPGSCCEGLSCTTIVNNHPELLTRYTHQGMQLKKVNIFAEKRWFELRAETEQEEKQINQFFQENRVVSWPVSTELQHNIYRFFFLKDSFQLLDKLRLEQSVIESLLLSMEQLPQASVPDESNTKSIANTLSLKDKVETAVLQNLSLPDIARSMGMSVRTLQRKFKTAYQCTVSDHIKSFRLNEGKKMLVLKNLSIGEAAYIAGYKHSTNFISAFKKEFGITPATYIERHAIKR